MVMKTITLKIKSNELIEFIKACDNVFSLNYIESIPLNHYTTEVTVEYKYDHCLWFLGGNFEIIKETEKIKQSL